jgi:hypothetical protein
MTMKELLHTILERLSHSTAAPALSTIPSGSHEEQIVAVRKDYTVERFRGRGSQPGRRHVFADVASLAAFIGKHMPDPTYVEVLADTDKIVAVSAAHWFRDEVSCVLAKDPDFVGWEKLLGRTIKQKELYRELIARQHTIVAAAEVVSAIQRLDLSKSNEATYSLTPNGNYDVVAKREQTSSTTKLPGGFSLSVPVYLGANPKLIEIKLLIEEVGVSEGSQPTFSLRAIDIERVKLDAYQEQVQSLRTLLGPSYLVGAGTLKLE